MEQRRVLGIDLALRHWNTIGQAMVSFQTGASPSWREVHFDVIKRQAGRVTAKALADAIRLAVHRHEISAVAIDGPHAWRSPAPEASPSPWARYAEIAVHAQAKTGPYGHVLPATMTNWVKLSLELFDRLLQSGGCLAEPNSDSETVVIFPADGFLLLETYPTATWRESKLQPLPSKRRASNEIVQQWSHRLVERYGLRSQATTSHHDNLQALVAALPAAGLLAGPAAPVPHGKPAAITERTNLAPQHRIEGYIWTALPHSQATSEASPIESARESSQDPQRRRLG